MTIADDFDILAILQGAVIAAVAAVDPELPVKAVGRTQTSPDPSTPVALDGQRYVEIVWIPNNPTGAFWGNEQNHMGLLRIVLHWPNDDAGAYTPGAVLAGIAAGLPKGQRFGTGPHGVQIYEPPSLMSPIGSPTETLYPCSLRYTAFRQGN
jgi:hypothetical protein